MKQLAEYRKQLLDHLVGRAREFGSACLAAANPLLPIGGGWNVHQIAAHTRDVDRLVYGLRARRTLHEENPEFPNFDGDAHLAKNYNPGEPLQVIASDLASSADELAGILRDLGPEVWSRPSRHATLGSGFTLQTWVERDLKHIEEHLATLQKAA